MEANEIKIWVYATSLILLLLGLFILLFFLSYKSKQQMHHRKITELQEVLLRSQIEIQEQTLRNISQEIHDNIGQTLSLAKLHLNTLNLTQTDTFQNKLLHSKELVSKAIADLRSLSKILHTDTILSAGLISAIEYELQLVERTGTFRTTLTIEGNVLKIEAQTELILFRIAQEALNNIIKHAGANRIDVNLFYEEDRLVLTIEDNGQGMPAGIIEKSPLVGGAGLKNMQSRANLIGGQLEIKTKAGSGTVVFLQLPIAST